MLLNHAIDQDQVLCESPKPSVDTLVKPGCSIWNASTCALIKGNVLSPDAQLKVIAIDDAELHGISGGQHAIPDDLLIHRYTGHFGGHFRFRYTG